MQAMCTLSLYTAQRLGMWGIRVQLDVPWHLNFNHNDPTRVFLSLTRDDGLINFPLKSI